MMIRTKAKTFLLSVMLVMACFVFFACKEKTEVKVESITFAEQSISLLVGEEYTPTIKVLPSYATTRSYTLISSDTTALSVEGGTITALKASNVMLKVVSDDNKNVNNMIAVSIYNEASELEVPTGLIFDGNEFTFVGKDNANAYMLKINGQEINIGNNTEYTFDNVASKIDNLYNNVISCSVKAVGDGKIFKDSAYSEEILFVKLSSVKNAYVENETLHFDTIDNVASYNVEVLIDGRVTQTMVASSGSLSLSGLTDSDAGAQYTLRIIPNTNNYNGVEENNVFVGNVAQLNYNVLGKVKNVAINENVVSWDFVKNAQNYTIELYKSSTQQLIQSYSNIPYNYLQINYSDFGIEGADIEGEYYCKIIANSNNINTTTGKVYCEPLYFTVLPTPQINIANNMVVWNDVVEAEGYLVTIKDNNGATIVNKSFVLQNSYNVSNFSAGTYYIEVVACGNGENGQNADVKVFLSSNVSQQAKWTILSALQTKIEGGLLYWQDFDGYTQNKYRVTFGDYNIVLTSNEYTYNDKTQTYTYDLAQYSLEPNLYTVSITSLGKDTIFDSSVSNLNIVKLEDSSIELSNKKFIVSKVDRAYEYKVKIYKSNDLNNAIETLDNMSGYEFALDSSLLDAGNYVAKVFTYGDGRYVFDADNLSDTTMVAFEKLPTPSIEVDSENLKIIVKEVKNAEGYALFENKSSKTIVDGEYSLANLTEGDYTYTAKAIGNTSTILDSDTTLIENAKVVKKLATPTITFDKDNLTFDVTCSDKDYVKDYTFTLDDNTISVINNQANAKTYIINAGKYEAKVYANPQSASVGYNLVITSNISNYTVTKLASVCDFAISNGNLIVTPSTETAELMTESGGYSLQLCIENGANDIILNDFNYSNSQFTTTIYDDEYNVREELISLMTSAGKYDVSTIISQNKENVVTSSSVTCENQLNVLGRVTSISKNAQTIEFGVVSDATNYIAVINLEGNDYYIDIAENYTTDTNNILVMQDLVGLMEGRLNYKEQVPYTISFVATNDDSRTIANKGVKTYSFEFLKTPTISIIEQDGENTKYLAILNDEINAHKYNVVISQETDVKNET
ncbi:MAG: hypothetical protein IJ371_03995, partial [Clostridia bacterium]|nr:hypothetical protein [Clostridia bacterium]